MYILRIVALSHSPFTRLGNQTSERRKNIMGQWIYLFWPVSWGNIRRVEDLVLPPHSEAFLAWELWGQLLDRSTLHKQEASAPQCWHRWWPASSLEDPYLYLVYVYMCMWRCAHLKVEWFVYLNMLNENYPFRPTDDSNQPPGRGVLSMHGLTYGVIRVDSEEKLSVLTVQDVGLVMPGGEYSLGVLSFFPSLLLQ